MLPESVTVWICPNCGSYFGSSSAGDLSETYNTNQKGIKLFLRARCPTPVCAGQDVMRIPLKLKTRPSVSEQPKVKPVEQDLPHWSGKLCLVCGKQLITTKDATVCSGCGKIILTDGASHS